MSGAIDGLRIVRERISSACERSGRQGSDVCLLAVSKRFPCEVIESVHEAGQVDFGESRQQEGAEKVLALPETIRWHFIGKLQRNKVRKVLKDFPVIHSVDSLKLAAYMDRIAAEMEVTPDVYLEINQAGEERKGGFSKEMLEAEFDQLLELNNINVIGFMSIPPVSGSAEDSRPWFRELRLLRDRFEERFDCSLPGLSMGMSGDFEVAIEEGSTVVRVGSGIFGQRPMEK
ncbi:MAG: YggS family pyridoxal phosphate-dependent enzyme [Haloferula sp.]